MTRLLMLGLLIVIGAIVASGRVEPRHRLILLPPPARLSIEERIVREAGPRLASLALAIAWRESRFNPKAISATHDFGVFQIHSGTAAALHLWRPLDADLNITAGVGLLRIGYAKYGTESGARCYFEHPARCGAER